MNITIFGSGYVGLVTGICLADLGHDVLCVDIDTNKISSLQAGELPIYEPGLQSLLKKNQEAGNLKFTSDLIEGVNHGLYQFIAVGTPPDENGAADLKYVLAVATTIGENINKYAVVITKSTVPVGSCDKVKHTIQQQLTQRGANVPFSVVSNPEFLKEGSAVDDFMKPDRIVIGVDDEEALKHMRHLYAPFNNDNKTLIALDVRSSELTKYAANAMLATKISFMNEISQIAERVGADVEKVKGAIAADPRIGPHFINPGCGYGGSCFPKDVRALSMTASQHHYSAKLLEAVDEVNEQQKQILHEKILKHFNKDISNKRFAVWGLAFKPNTDDMREAPSRVLLDALFKGGASVSAFDPTALKEASRIYSEHSQLKLCESLEETLENADVLVIVTECDLFKSPDFKLLKQKLRDPVVFDGRNLFTPTKMAALGFTYYSVGRSVPELVG